MVAFDIQKTRRALDTQSTSRSILSKTFSVLLLFFKDLPDTQQQIAKKKKNIHEIRHDHSNTFRYEQEAEGFTSF